MSRAPARAARVVGPDAPRVAAFAHRGGAGHPDLIGLENTLPAFEHAVALGYDLLETDVHATRDGVLVALHDERLDRVSDSAGAIADLPYSVVRGARIRGAHQVPTLAELFDRFPDARFNLDLKAAGAVRPLADFLMAREAWDRVLVGSFSAARLARFRRLTRGRVATSAHPAEVAAFRLLPSARLADQVTRRRVAALQIPHRRGRLTVATRGLIRRAHRVGVRVDVWTVDDPAEMRALIARGVDGLMTDRTDLLRQTLEAEGLWREDSPQPPDADPQEDPR
ncbi:glycerophosphodiester phosphodiesterase [Nocardioides insulae]|uniref:glycerophosphodiester phosphodiesterase n=1 Tax=Nocardioides insulae TaxID=394734 RepID=UPI000428D0E1|nr:glycerophosphodiester phosphodiesterase [Nocardioides insulae]